MEANLKLQKSNKVRVLVADDSPTVRLMLCRMLEKDPDIKVVGTAGDGREAIEQVEALEPDLVTMDVNMPVLDGLSAIEHIMAYNPVPILVVSSVVGKENTANAASALGAGAVDVICKPTPSSLEDFDSIGSDLRVRIKMLSRVRVITHPRARLLDQAIDHPASAASREKSTDGNRIVAIGSSTGGPQALQRILCSLPAAFKAGVVIVQHIAPGFTDGLIEWLSGSTNLKIVKGSDGLKIEPGVVVIAPDGIHMTVTSGERIKLIERQMPGPHKPSVDVLLESVADVYGDHAVGVILTGMGRDGAQGIKAIHERGGRTIAQDRNTSVIFSMAKEAIKLGGVDQVVPLSDVSRLMMELT